ncbi:prepilin signal peptidase PulO-like peptidase [Methanomethylovorans hollandica DSM 15978]|uniref:Prepilin signal peptidase PulO-like peptidase n=1 Tax=Methanomethylovorans hollandica (strain DSM 15978 / NBRC 107637 / DMS1) TaxID=867904 RepID=L0KV31_METHD|nr:A24 family peptidase C-terminal domain-containing protein [Methanomethylovorans hollandica]AGB48560.1 prepilin signal peptidase PulO-like peptidase [Methanomethylovorans hollandica DSM 15978]
MLELLKVLVCLPFLAYSCYSDIKTRRVSNKVWPIMLGAASPFILHEMITSGLPYIFRTVISFVVIFIFVYILFILHAFGGADAKVLMVISIILPVFPQLSLNVVQLPLWGVPLLDLFTFSVFGNSVLMTIIVPLGLLIYNLVTVPPKELIKKPLYALIGYRQHIDNLEEGHFRLIEKHEETPNGVVQRFTRTGTSVDRDMILKLQALHRKGSIGEHVWITPGLPFMIPITAGFLAAILFGDLIFHMSFNYLVPLV